MAKKKKKDELEAVAKEKAEPAKDEELTPVTDEDDDDDEEMNAIVEEAIAEGIALYDKFMEEAKKGPEPELDDVTKELLAAETIEERVKILRKHNITLWCE